MTREELAAAMAQKRGPMTRHEDLAIAELYQELAGVMKAIWLRGDTALRAVQVKQRSGGADHQALIAARSDMETLKELAVVLALGCHEAHATRAAAPEAER